MAVTVMLEIPGGVPLVGLLTALRPPPQLTMNNVRTTPVRTLQRRLAFLFVRKLPATSKPNTIPIDDANVLGCNRATGTAAELGAVVLMVSKVETGSPLGIRLAGENVQLEAAGNPVHPNVTAEFMPFTGFNVMENVAAWPALMVALCGNALMVKSPGTDSRISSTTAGDVA